MQKGPVTRVASGCMEEEQKELQELMDKQPERFRVHFTPDYSVDPQTGQMLVHAVLNPSSCEVPVYVVGGRGFVVSVWLCLGACSGGLVCLGSS